jgi:hypothetical protein
MPPDDLPFELEVIQPVQSVNGTELYRKVSRQPCGPTVDSNGQPLRYGGVPLVIEIDEKNNEQGTSPRSDGVNSHLVRQTLPPVVEAPAGYYLTEPVPTTTRHKFIRDDDGRMIGAEVEQTAKPRTGFGLR